MSKTLKIFLAALVMFCFTFVCAHAVATLGGTLVKKIPGKRMIVIKLKSGAEKNVVLVGQCKAYRLNQKALLTSFRIGEEVVVKLCGPLNEDPLKAEILMDRFSSTQYSSFKTVTPTYNKTNSGGFATTSGAAPAGLPPVQGVYPNSVSGGWPNNNTLPQSVSGMGTSASASSTMTAAPSPWGSPAMGAVLSGGGGDGASWGSPSSGGGTISAAPPSGGNGSIANTGTGPSGVTPEQANWVTNPTAEKKRVQNISFQGKIFQVNQEYSAIYVNKMGDNKTYTVMIRPKTKVLDYMTKMPLTLADLRTGLVTQVTGTTASEGIVDAVTVMVQR